MKRIAVFCGSNAGANANYQKTAVQMGKLLVQNGIGLVYGGGNTGLMGAIANSVLESDGEGIGVIPTSLVAKEVAHLGLTKLHVVESMHRRKQMMADLSDAFMTLPGGLEPSKKCLRQSPGAN